MHTPSARLAILGGSGLYQMDGLTIHDEVRPHTPFGDPSDAIAVGMLGNVPTAFLPRHGRGHQLSPSEVPSRANIYALKALGVEWILSVSAVGSLREDYAPLDLVIPDQLFDRTKMRPSGFFEGGVVAHVAFAEPFCPHLSGLLATASGDLGGTRAHRGGTYVCIEGPQFSTRAESRIYRQLGCDIIGMTALPEAKLAREAEICYATIACVTDYDVWRESEEQVTVEMVVANLARNVATAQRLLRAVAASLPADRAAVSCGCASALRGAIMTPPALISTSLRERYHVLISKYLAG
ncbi:MAG: S-methyl-5'-thioadenosine phosphorylase [Ktedonobacterales bacterium]|nr:S-methyl-5'-thioadenosine phosphorylase [Ktedonobacterales bacterium]